MQTRGKRRRALLNYRTPLPVTATPSQLVSSGRLIISPLAALGSVLRFVPLMQGSSLVNRLVLAEP